MFAFKKSRIEHQPDKARLEVGGLRGAEAGDGVVSAIEELLVAPESFLDPSAATRGEYDAAEVEPPVSDKSRITVRISDNSDDSDDQPFST